MANMIVAVHVYSSISGVSKGFAELLLSLIANQCYPFKLEIFLAATKVFFCGLLSNTYTRWIFHLLWMPVFHAKHLSKISVCQDPER